MEFTQRCLETVKSLAGSVGEVNSHGVTVKYPFHLTVGSPENREQYAIQGWNCYEFRVNTGVSQHTSHVWVNDYCVFASDLSEYDKNRWSVVFTAKKLKGSAWYVLCYSNKSQNYVSDTLKFKSRNEVVSIKPFIYEGKSIILVTCSCS